MADIQVKGLKKVTDLYRKMEKRYPTLRRNTLNDMARDAQKNAQKIVKSKFINRNQFTLRSIVFDKATRAPNSTSAVGSLQKYLADQEFGNSSLKVGHIPTTVSTTTRSRRRPVSRPNKINRIGTASSQRFGKPNVRRHVASNRANNIRSPMKLSFQGKKGKVKGLFRFDRNKKRNIIMIQDLRKSHVTIKQQKWLEPATLITLRKGQKLFENNLKFFVS